MIKLEKTDIYGWEAAIRGMRNPLNSWDKSDSYENYEVDFEDDYEIRIPYYRIGSADVNLMNRLAEAGNDHAKFLRMINVTVDITAPLYWWKEFDTYKIGTVANSCSTMHKIHSKEFVLDDFSYEHLLNNWNEDADDELYYYNDEYANTSLDVINWIIGALNHFRNLYLETKDKKYWWQMIQLLPTSYNQKRTIQLNYQVLKAMYHSRKNHKLDEWIDFCKWIEKLPYNELITNETKGEEK